MANSSSQLAVDTDRKVVQTEGGAANQIEAHKLSAADPEFTVSMRAAPKEQVMVGDEGDGQARVEVTETEIN